VMINCRCEGAKDVPAFDFQDVGYLTLIGLTNEGRRENPALFRFTNCFHVVAINPGLASPDVPYAGGKHADGMLFDNCHEFTVMQPLASASFTELGDSGGDYTSRAIRIKNNCRYGVIRGLHCKHWASDTDIEIEAGAKDCFVEAFGDGRGPLDPSTGLPSGGLVGIGKLVADGLRGSPAFAWSPSLVPTHPTGYDLEIGGGDGGKPGKDLAGNTVIQLGQPDANGNTAQLLFRKGPAGYLGRVWYQAGTYMKIESLGTSLRFRSDNDIVLEQKAGMIALESQGHLYFTSGYGGALPTFIWRGNGGSTARTDTMPHNQPNVHDYAPTVPLIAWQHDGSDRISFNGTGLAFNDKAPIAKPTVTGSRGGNSALQSLLSALENLGLIKDATSP
jgi:hypothetical protein